MNSYDKEIIKIVLTAILILVLVSVVITLGIIKYSNSHYEEESIALVHVDDKYFMPYKVNNIYIFNYYIVSDNKSLEVSEKVYSDTKIGDYIKIKIITIYSKKNNEICRQKFSYEGASE